MTDKEQLTDLYERVKVLEEEKVNDKFIQPMREKIKALESKLSGAYK